MKEEFDINSIINKAQLICRLCLKNNEYSIEYGNKSDKITEVSFQQSLKDIYDDYKRSRSGFVDSQLSTVWILISEDEGERKIYQVGRNNNLMYMFTHDILPDITSILGFGKRKKYQKLKGKNIEFYEVKIDCIYKEIELPDNTFFGLEDINLKKAEYNIKTYIVEGYLAYISGADERLWNRSGGIDGNVFDYFKASKQQTVFTFSHKSSRIKPFEPINFSENYIHLS